MGKSKVYDTKSGQYIDLDKLPQDAKDALYTKIKNSVINTIRHDVPK